MPTGVALRDARTQLFEAAERVLLRAGPSALTSRAVTDEAGVAKGVLHRHFTDFDGFLTEFVLDRIGRIGDQSAALLATAGTGTVVGNLTSALMDLFASVPASIVTLVISRGELQSRLRLAGAGRVPVAMEATAMIAAYLTAERDLGRLAADADLTALAPTLIGAAHLQFADRQGGPPDTKAIRKVVAAVIAGAAG